MRTLVIEECRRKSNPEIFIPDIPKSKILENGPEPEFQPEFFQNMKHREDGFGMVLFFDCNGNIACESCLAIVLDIDKLVFRAQLLMGWTPPLIPLPTKEFFALHFQ